MVLAKAAADPYRRIARYFPLLDRLMDLFLGRLRRDLIRTLKGEGLSRILDLGCGTGDLSRIMADQGLHPVGLDISPAMLDKAKKTAQKPPSFPLVLADGGRLPFKPRFDAAVLRFVFHEMGASLREEAWNELQGVIRPGGLLILIDFTVPENRGPYARLGRAVIHFIEHRMDAIYPPHYLNYRDLMAKGGAAAWIAGAETPAAASFRYFGGNLGLIALRVNGGANKHFHFSGK